MDTSLMMMHRNEFNNMLSLHRDKMIHCPFHKPDQQDKKNATPIQVSYRRRYPSKKKGEEEK